MKKIFIITILFLFNTIWSIEELNILKDKDGNVYKTVQIGSQVWMAENLNVKTKDGSWCYNNDSTNCEKYGRLYDWLTLMRLPEECDSLCFSKVTKKHRGICPKGWHIPTKDEYKILFSQIGGENIAAKKLKSKETWNKNGHGTDEFNFSILASGYRPGGKHFYSMGDIGTFWTASQSSSFYYVSSVYVNRLLDQIFLFERSRIQGHSVRCLMD